MTSQTADRSRFEAIWRQHRHQVLAYCLRRASTADAEDACAETFLVVWRRIDEIPSAPKTLPCLYGIARKSLSNQTRAFYRRGRLHTKLTNLGMTTAADPMLVVVQSADDKVVTDAVRRLRPVDREIVMLDVWEDLSRTEIAEVMGMTRAAVDQRIHRAYQKLSLALEPVLEIRSIASPPIAEEGGT
ncbi:MAG TPA: sigma-70 family RNA polymerase sigma factor [Acidimicrobiia bacterium]|nr:sigma-70 family RNA polymerase sigma factor [Acidimicrobiia bacterium]